MGVADPAWWAGDGYGDGSGDGYQITRVGNVVTIDCQAHTTNWWLSPQGERVADKYHIPIAARACLRALLERWRDEFSVDVEG